MGIAQDMRQLRQEIEAARLQRAQGARRRRARLAELSQETASIREQARQELQANAQLMVEIQNERLLELGHQVQAIRQECRGFLSEFRQDFHGQSAQRRQERRANAIKHQHYFQNLQQEVATLRTELQHALELQKVEGQQKRREATEKVQQEVQVLREELQQLLHGYRAELAEVREFWTAQPAPQSVEPPAQEAQASASVAPSRVPEATRAPEVSRAPKVAKPARKPGEHRDPDDLERIVGIGPSTKQVLYEAGLFYFDDLATMSPEAVTEMLGSLARFANVDHWIEQAQTIVAET